MVPKEVRNMQLDDSMLKPVEAIIHSMTPAERADPSMINGSRRTRIAAGSGTTVQAVNELLDRFKQVQAYMRTGAGAGRRVAPERGQKGGGQAQEAALRPAAMRRSLTPGRASPAPVARSQDQLVHWQLGRDSAYARSLTEGTKANDMAVKLRLMRMGKTKQPTYRVVAADSRSPRDGRFIEIVGSYAPRQQENKVVFKENRVTTLAAGRRPAD